MARLVGFLLLLAGIYLGVVVYTEGTDRAFGGWLASEDEAAPAPESAAQAPMPEAAQPAGTPSRTAITSRVREKVQGTVDDRSDRIGSY